jgi:hypothetical protein
VDKETYLTIIKMKYEIIGFVLFIIACFVGGYFLGTFIF